MYLLARMQFGIDVNELWDRPLVRASTATQRAMESAMLTQLAS